MLKIKDNVTYQKLNSLGFRLDDFNDCYNWSYGYLTISISKKRRTLMTYVEEGYETLELVYDEFTTIEDLFEYFPRLIDLVENVED